MRILRIAAEILVAAAAAVLLLRYWPGARPEPAGSFEIIAHRGVHQVFDERGVGRDTCTADRIDPVRHAYIENTLPSIEAAFRAGATTVEIDVHDTSDGHIVVFHDWTLDCRTNGHGVTHEQPLGYLQSLDVGYGYTADGGHTFPLRGTGIGAMPTLEQVLDRFPQGQFILDQKSDSLKTVEVLASVLRGYPADRLRKLSYWGTRYNELAARIPAIGRHVLSRDDMKRCGVDYALTLGVTGFPASCADATLMLPIWMLDVVWGFPNRFVQDALTAHSTVIVTDVDTLEDAARVRELPIHGVMTNHIEVVGPGLAPIR